MGEDKYQTRILHIPCHTLFRLSWWLILLLGSLSNHDDSDYDNDNDNDKNFEKNLFGSSIPVFGDPSGFELSTPGL